MTDEKRAKAKRVYEAGLLNSCNFKDIPEIVTYQGACKEFNKQQKAFEEWLYSDKDSTELK